MSFTCYSAQSLIINNCCNFIIDAFWCLFQPPVMVKMYREGEELTQSQMIEGKIRGDLWSIPCCFLDIQGPVYYHIHGKPWERHTFAIDKPGEVVVDGDDMQSSMGSVMFLRGSTGTNKVMNSLRG